MEPVVKPNNNLFEHTLNEVKNDAPEALVNTLKIQMNKIKEKYPHNVQAVDHCMPVLENNPKLMDVLVICYILNGGVLLKHTLDDEASDEEEVTLDAFLAELECSA